MSESSSNNKRIAKNTLFLYIRMLFMMLVGLLTSRVILDSLGAVDYGIYNVVGGFVSMFTVFRAGMSSATQRFITYELGRSDKEALHKTFDACLAIYIIISIVVVISAEIVGIWFIEKKLMIPDDRLYAAGWVFQLSLLALVINLISTPYNALVVSHEHMSAFAYISIFEALAHLIIAYLIYITDYDKLITYSVLICLIQLIVRFLYTLYCKRKFEESSFSFSVPWGKMREIYSFTVWAMFGSLASIGFTQGLNVLLNMFFSPVINAARALAVQVQHAINHFVTNFQMAVNPQIIKSYAKNDKKYMYRLIFASSKFSFFLLFFLSLPVMIETDQILSLWLKKVPEYTSIFFRLIIVTTMIDGISNPIMRAVDATGNIKRYQLTVGGLLLTIVPIAYVVLKMGGAPYSVFIVHVVICVLAFITRLYLARNIVGFSIEEYYKHVISRILYVCVLSVIPPYLLFYNLQIGGLRLTLVCIVSFISVALTVYSFGLVHEERKWLIDKTLYLIKSKIFHG